MSYLGSLGCAGSGVQPHVFAKVIRGCPQGFGLSVFFLVVQGHTWMSQGICLAFYILLLSSPGIVEKMIQGAEGKVWSAPCYGKSKPSFLKS